MMPGSSRAFTGAGDMVVPDQLVAGLRVLVVDQDQICLMVLKNMLRDCNYQATTCNRVEKALSLLRENRNGYDIVLTEVHMPDMDGFKLLEEIGMDLPVILMSADDSNSLIMKAVIFGACDFLIKPIPMEPLRTMWQHMVRRRIHRWKILEPITSGDDDDQQEKGLEYFEFLSSANNDHRNEKRRKEDEAEAEEAEKSSSSKKPRFVWSLELHTQFVAAVQQLGMENATPKKILELMTVRGITRENIASHLQKYRNYLRGRNGPQHLESTDADYRTTNHQDLVFVSQLRDKSFEAAVLGSSSNSKYPISTDHGNIYCFQNPQFFHGIASNMEPKQLVGLNPHSFNVVNAPRLLIPTSGQSQFQNLWNSNHHISDSPNGLLASGSGTQVPTGEMVPSYDTLNDDLNQITPYHSEVQDIIGTTLNEAPSHSSGKKTAATLTLSLDEEHRTT